jgi:DNA-binding response OmpR family regulator
VTNILKAIEFYDDDYILQARNPDKLRTRLSALRASDPIIDSPDDARNLVVLCQQHHRFKFTGIHSVSFPLWLAISAVPSAGGILSREQLLAAVERVSKIDDELAAFAANNYQPNRI